MYESKTKQIIRN